MDSVFLTSIIGSGGTEGGHDVTGLLLTLLILFAAAKIGAEIFERLNQPAVVGEIIAGVLVGPQVFHLVRESEATLAMSELGVIFLLFLVGLETKPSDLFRVGKDALLVAVGGVALPFVLGYGVAMHQGWSQPTALFVGAALVATSVGITARVLGRLGVLHALTSRIILGAAVIDDVLGLLVLAVVSGFVRGTGVDYHQIVLTALYAFGFVAFMLLYGVRFVAKARPVIERLHIGHSYYLVAIAICLALSVAAGRLGIAAIIGAFLAGVALSELSEDTGLHRWFEGLSEFFVPFFLAGIGMQLNLQSLGKGNVLILCLVITLLAVLGKLIGCGLPVLKRGRQAVLQVGVGMAPRGEVGIIVAQFGLRLGVFTDDLFAIILFVSVVTTMIAPPLLGILYASETKSHPADEGANATEAGIEIS